jgi:hypothetical protein
MVSLATRESTLRMLVERLRWPVRMVRWRAAQEYASLIANRRQRKAALGVYLDWLANRQLENEVISGLAVLQCLEEGDLPDFGAVSSNINAPSVLADVVLQTLYGRGKTRGDWERRHSGAAPPSFKPDTYFTDHKTAHIPGHLSHQFESLERCTGFPLIRQWAFEWTQLTNITKSPTSDFPYFFVDISEHRRGINGQFSQRQCDVYRSAFLRTIAFAVERGMPMTFAEQLSTETVAVNVDFVKLKPTMRPTWLRNFPERCVLPDVSLEVECRNILAGATANGLFAANLKVPISLDVEKYGELRLSAVLATPDFDVIEDDSDAYFWRDLWEVGETTSFNRVLPKTVPEDSSKPGKTGSCRLLTLEVWPLPSGFWHNDYFHTGVSVPAPHLASPTPSVECSARSLKFLSAGKLLGEWVVWHDHWSTIYPDAGHPRCGMMTTIEPTTVANAEAAQNLKLGWIAELKTWRAKNDYDKLELARSISFFWS